MPPQPQSPFPPSTRSSVWTTLVTWLQNDPVLKAGVDLWQVMDGSDESNITVSEEDLPFLRITSMGGPGQWLDENSHQHRWAIKIEIGVSGLNAPDIFDFWGAVETALFTGNDLLFALEQFNVIQKTITMPATEIKAYGASTGLYAAGTLTILMRIDS